MSNVDLKGFKPSFIAIKKFCCCFLTLFSIIFKSKVPACQDVFLT